MKKSMKGPATVDQYMADLPEKEREVLSNIRKTIKATAPKAEEAISYGMPGYKYHGMLVYFAAFKNHLSFFPGSSMIDQFGEEVQKYKTSKGTLQFTVDKPITTSLVKKIVKARMKQNEANALAKQLKKSTSKKTTRAKSQ
ncbi:MAG TPA: DUF1801 domain-containing protein [Cyclobacteriaceae bacterium]|nr:DUF1801 domain-containing protein [Cyclobacteriaceae bacterium]